MVLRLEILLDKIISLENFRKIFSQQKKIKIFEKLG